MTNKYIIFKILIAIILFPAVLHAQQDSYVKFESSPSPGVITVIATGIGKTKEISNTEACRKLIRTFLFTGIAGSAYENPAITEEAQDSNTVVVELITSKYGRFLIENKILNADKLGKKTDGLKGIETENCITINCETLIRYLQQKRIN